MKKFRSFRENIGKFCYFKDGKYYLDELCTRELTYNIDCHFDWDETEQCTNLFDKNGKEVYLNDVVKSSIHGDGLIKWDEYNTGFYIDYIHKFRESAMHHLSVCEIVGNIHDTPELIKH